jgi:hypothetical protein
MCLRRWSTTASSTSGRQLGAAHAARQNDMGALVQADAGPQRPAGAQAQCRCARLRDLAGLEPRRPRAERLGPHAVRLGFEAHDDAGFGIGLGLDPGRHGQHDGGDGDQQRARGDHGNSSRGDGLVSLGVGTRDRAQQMSQAR